MKYKFIPVNNDLNKAKAFANTLDPNYIQKTQRIKQTEFYIPTIDVVQKLQNEGWMINGVDEQRNKKSRKIINNYVQMTHPDFAVKNSKGKDEAYSSITLTNSCSGDQPLQMSLGAYRMVCANGAISFREDAESEKIKHTEINYRDLDRFIQSMNGKAQDVIAQLNTWKQKDMTFEQMRKLAYNAARLRFNETDENQACFYHKIASGDLCATQWRLYAQVGGKYLAGINRFFCSTVSRHQQGHLRGYAG
jgi:hypothetical protein